MELIYAWPSHSDSYVLAIVHLFIYYFTTQICSTLIRDILGCAMLSFKLRKDRYKYNPVLKFLWAFTLKEKIKKKKENIFNKKSIF